MKTKKAKHTPKSWRIVGSFTIMYQDDIIASVKRFECNRVCADVGDKDPYAEEKANARLIAASPELLAACDAAIALLDTTTPSGRKAYEMARAAIAKAEGGK